MKMICLFLSTFIITSALFSQESKMAFGLQVAPSITSIRGNSMVDTYDSRFVISPEITLDYHITQNFTINSGLAFERKGAKTKLFLTDETGMLTGRNKLNLNFDYFTLPLMVTYNTKGRVNFYFGGGTFLGFLISQKNTSDVILNSPQPGEDNTENTKRIDSGLSFTGGLTIPVTNKLLMELGLREYLGLINTSKVDILDGGSIKTNSFGLLIGLNYKI